MTNAVKGSEPPGRTVGVGVGVGGAAQLWDWQRPPPAMPHGICGLDYRSREFLVEAPHPAEGCGLHFGGSVGKPGWRSQIPGTSVVGFGGQDANADA
jgi:hypothetical protein